MTDTTELKEWQVLAGRFASLANWASLKLAEQSGINSNDHDRANEITDEVADYLIFDESE